LPDAAVEPHDGRRLCSAIHESEIQLASGDAAVLAGIADSAGSSRVKIIGIALAVFVALYAGYSFAFPTVTVRYRLAIEVDADGQTYVGSGVLEAAHSKGIPWMSNYSSVKHTDVKGEAVAVDIGSRGTLFVLLTQGKGPYSEPGRTLPKAFGFRNGYVNPPPAPDFQRLRELSGRKEVATEDLPLLVRFRDINDPKTVERVDPDNLAASFGGGAYLKRATVEITRERITKGIEKKLAWLATLRSRRANLEGETRVGRSSNELANILGPGSFQTGVK
jgi:hypothetical protein